MNKQARNQLALAVGLALLGAVPQAMVAQGYGRVANDAWSGRVTVINTIPIDRTRMRTGGAAGAMVTQMGGTSSAPKTVMSVDLHPVLIAYWGDQKEKMRTEALAFLHEKNIGGGFRTGNNGLTLVPDGPLYAGWDGRGFSFKWVLPGNHLETQIRTPGPAPSGWDPKFQLFFDLTILGDVDVQNKTLRVAAVRVQPKVYRPAGRNFTGDAATAANNLVATLSGTDFIGQFLNRINGQTVPVSRPLNLELAKLSPALAKATAGVDIQPGFTANPNQVTLTLGKAAPLNVH
ncbi:MAG TPA: hypothetical protein VF461_18925 [Gemmatimonadaceae bacterium]